MSVVVYRWAEVSEYLEEQLQNVHYRMEDADGPEMHRLQGEARALRKMLNLPNILTVLKE